MKIKRPWIMSFALIMGAAGASAQVVPSYRRVPNIGFYGTATFQQPNFSDIGDRVRGVIAGAYFQPRYYIGVDVRAVALQQVGYYHQFSALGGPRVAMHLWHTNPYAALDVGLSRNSRRLNPTSDNGYSTEAHSTDIQFCALGGLELHVLRHLSLNLPEVSYSNIYGSGDATKSISYGAGFVLRLR